LQSNKTQSHLQTEIKNESNIVFMTHHNTELKT
jgi:hypothetical protein